MNKILTTFLVCCITLVMLIIQSVQIVPQTHYAIILRLGKIRSVIRDPGLYFTVPLLDEIKYITKMGVQIKVTSFEVMSSGKKRFAIDGFLVARIKDPKRFYTIARNLQNFELRVIPSTQSAWRGEIASHTLNNILQDRGEILSKVIHSIESFSAKFGVSINGAEITSINLLQGNESGVFGKMKAEMEKEANFIKAKYEKEYEITISDADRNAREMVAKANETAKKIKADADADAALVRGREISKDRTLFEYIVTLDNIRKMNDKYKIMTSASEIFGENGK